MRSLFAICSVLVLIAKSVAQVNSDDETGGRPDTTGRTYNLEAYLNDGAFLGVSFSASGQSTLK